MKLATFEKTNTATRTEYVVFSEHDTKVDRFILDYTGDVEKCNLAIYKRQKLIKAGAVVRYVDINKAAMCLSVTVSM